MQQTVGSNPDWVKPKTIKLVKLFLLRSAYIIKYIKNKDRLARNQNNMSEWGDMSIRGLLFQ